jgi:malate dehydrogenase
VTQLIPLDRLQAIIERAKVGGGEIVKLMGTSAYYAPASGTIQMAEAIIKDKKRIIPCAAYCKNEYGVGGYFVGVPCILGAGGVEKVIEIKLNEDEKRLLATSVSHVKELVQVADGFLG